MGTICQKTGKRGTVWEIDYYDRNGRRHWETIRMSKSDAVAALRDCACKKLISLAGTRGSRTHLRGV